MKQILERLDRLEQTNRALTEQVQALRQELAATHGASKAEEAAPLDSYLPERVEVNENRIAEQAQTKVEASQRFPIQLTGMALFNAFGNSRGVPAANKSLLDPVSAGRGSSGATISQSILGFVYRGPETLWGGKVHGSLYMDFASTTDDYAANAAGSFFYESFNPRVRTAEIGIDWKTRSFTVGQLKPIVAPREPDSLAQVAMPPLSNAGNLWLWLPQVRFEQRASLGEKTGLSAQLGVIQTGEHWALISSAFAPTLESARPGVEGRVELAHNLDGDRRFAIAPGFHFSTTHVARASVPSRLFSLDGEASPWRKLRFTGALFTGENIANLGGLAQGFRILGDRNVRPVHAGGGWGQVTVLATGRLSFHLYGGAQLQRERDLGIGSIGTSTAYAANMMYQLAPNVRLALESGQTRFDFVQRGQRLRNYYDLALAYFF